MKKAISKGSSGPSVRSLREMPEIDFKKYRLRRNNYADRIAREGIQIMHEGPSAASLREMPEADFVRGRPRANKYARKGAAAAAKLQYGKGRPRKEDRRFKRGVINIGRLRDVCLMSHKGC